MTEYRLTTKIPEEGRVVLELPPDAPKGLKVVDVAALA